MSLNQHKLWIFIKALKQCIIYHDTDTPRWILKSITCHNCYMLNGAIHVRDQEKWWFPRFHSIKHLLTEFTFTPLGLALNFVFLQSYITLCQDTEPMCLWHISDIWSSRHVMYVIFFASKSIHLRRLFFILLFFWSRLCCTIYICKNCSGNALQLQYFFLLLATINTKMLLLDSKQRERGLKKKRRIACHFLLIDVSNYIIFSPLETGTCFCISIIISHSKACRQPISWRIFPTSPPSLLYLSLPKKENHNNDGP